VLSDTTVTGADVTTVLSRLGESGLSIIATSFRQPFCPVALSQFAGFVSQEDVQAWLFRLVVYVGGLSEGRDLSFGRGSSDVSFRWESEICLPRWTWDCALGGTEGSHAKRTQQLCAT